MEVQTSLLQAHDWLGSFLQEFSDLDEPLELHSSTSDSADDSCSSVSSVVRPLKAQRPKKPLARTCAKPANGDRAVAARHRRLKHNDRVKTLYNEIHALLVRLQPDPAHTSKTDWKQRATSERHARDRAQLENALLKKRLADSVRFRDEVEKMLLKHQELMPRRFLAINYSVADDDTHVYGLLRSDLLKRQFQLEASLKERLDEIMVQSLKGCAVQANERWDVVTNSQGLRMDVEESVVMPVNASAINAAICKYTQRGSISVAGDSVVDRVVRGVMANDVEVSFAVDHVVGGRQLEGRSVMRRVRNELGTVLLWETMSCWQGSDATDKDPLAIVRESGWSVIAPVQDELSVCHFQKTFRISASDGSRMKKRDPLVRKIVHTCQEFHRVQSRRTENIVVDTSMQRPKLST